MAPAKTTLISYLLRHNVDFGMFISPDEIAPGIRALNNEVRSQSSARSRCFKGKPAPARYASIRSS